VIEALEKTQIKFQALWFDAHFDGKIEFDTKLYEVKQIIGERRDDIGIWYKVLWKGGSTTEERRSTLEGEDTKGKWIVGAFKKYLRENKK
jgi:hypothetical protein